MERFEKLKFERRATIDAHENMYIYDIKYYENNLNSLEELHEGERLLGTLKVKR